MVSKSFEGKVCERHSLKVLVCQSVRLARLHHGPQPDRNVHHVNEYDQVSDLLPTYSTINMGCAWHHFSLDICRFRIYNLTRCSSFERVSYHSNYEKERTTETFQYPVVKSGRYGPSCRCYMYTVICYRWILTSLSNCCCSAYLHARRGNSLFITHSNILFAVPSGAGCMGEIRGHSKMEGLQRFTD